ncbi:MAG: cupin domain-containing protein [Alphaproteobacteria bacterium]|nr:cupin domain-containing protein [Alphaproteobacteria bacterium]
MTRDDYEAHLKRHGYEPAMERTKPAGATDGRHTHEFDACLYMLAGEYTLGYDDGERTYRPGDMFEVPRGTPHAETVGATEIRYLVGRRGA